MNLVIIRENEEDTYAGIEHRQTSEVVQTLKLISRPGSEAIVRYAFEYARAHGRSKVTCMTKDNIMKMTDGLFHRVFDEIAPEYPEIETEHRIIDIGTAIVAARPHVLDVVVAPNLYGDIISDVAAEVSGSVGVAGSANIGSDFAMFEAIHGSAPDIAGRGVANPSGLLNGAVMMLVHLGHPRVAETIKNAWLATLEAGLHTPDIFRERSSERQVTTDGFADAVIERLGETPKTLEAVHYGGAGVHVTVQRSPRAEKALVGVDVFLDWDEADRRPDALGERLGAVASDGLTLKLITNRGVQGLPRRPPRDVLHRPLALPLRPDRAGRHAGAGRRAPGRARRGGAGRHQDGEPVHVRRRARLLPRPGRVATALQSGGLPRGARQARLVLRAMRTSLGTPGDTYGFRAT